MKTLIAGIGVTCCLVFVCNSIFRFDYVLSVSIHYSSLLVIVPGSRGGIICDGCIVKGWNLCAGLELCVMDSL